MIAKVFKALERIGQEKGFLNYYINLMFKMLKRAAYCKPAEVPEILADSFRGKDNEMMMDSQSDIPYFLVNTECLNALNQVIRKA